MKIFQVIPEMNTVRAFLKRVKSKEAKRSLEIVDEIANLICYYARVQDNAEEMMQAWEI